MNLRDPLRLLTLLPSWEPVLTLWVLGSLWLQRNSNAAMNQSTSIGRQWCFQKKNTLWSLGIWRENNVQANTFTKNNAHKRFEYWGLPNICFNIIKNIYIFELYSNNDVRSQSPSEMSACHKAARELWLPHEGSAHPEEPTGWMWTQAEPRTWSYYWCSSVQETEEEGGEERGMTEKERALLKDKVDEYDHDSSDEEVRSHPHCKGVAHIHTVKV